MIHPDPGTSAEELPAKIKIVPQFQGFVIYQGGHCSEKPINKLAINYLT